MALKAKETNPVDSTKISRCVSLHGFTLGFRCMPQALELGPLGFQSQLLHSPAVQSWACYWTPVLIKCWGTEITPQWFPHAYVGGKYFPQMVRGVFKGLPPSCCDFHPQHRTRLARVQVQLSLPPFGRCSCFTIDPHCDGQYSPQASLLGPLVALCLLLSGEQESRCNLR